MSDVATPSKEHREAQARLQLPRALMGGTRVMRAKGETYLPRNGAESVEAYKERLMRSVLFNSFRRTVQNMAGKVFAKPIAVGDDMPEKLVEMVENVDLTGRHLNVFGYDAFEDGLQTGGGYILVDMKRPVQRSDGRPATLADERDAGLRPYFVFVPVDRMLGWKSEEVGGREVLTQVRILECVSEPDGEWNEKEVEQVRVLKPGSFEVWRQSSEGENKGQWYIHESGATSLNKITLAPIYMTRRGFMMMEPPLEDLGDLNVCHWQKKSDLDNIMHVANVPILFASGLPDDAPGLVIGSGSMTRASDPNAKLSYIEHTGAAIGKAIEDLKHLEFSMQAMGMELLVPKPGEQTATGRAIDQAAMHAPLQLMALALQDALEQAFGFAAEYLGLGENAGGQITVNTDFGVSMRDASDLQALIAACNAGYITPKRLLMEFQRRGVLASDVNPSDEAEEAQEQGIANGMVPPSLPAPGQPVTDNGNGE